jgi:methionine biosynthesis protein MetW
MFNFPWIRKPDFKSISLLDYDDYWNARGFSINKKLKERETIILNRIPAGSRVLDVGCGNSRLPLELKAKGCDVTVADISQKVLEGFTQSGIPTQRLDLSQVEDFDYQAKFDYIILSEVLEHLPNPEEAITKLLPFSEFIIITIPNSAYYWFRFGLMFRGRFFTQWVHHPSEHLRFWSHLDFKDWLEAMGLSLVKSQASNGWRLFKDIWPNLFGFQIVYIVKTNKSN